MKECFSSAAPRLLLSVLRRALSSSLDFFSPLGQIWLRSLRGKTTRGRRTPVRNPSPFPSCRPTPEIDTRVPPVSDRISLLIRLSLSAFRFAKKFFTRIIYDGIYCTLSYLTIKRSVYILCIRRFINVFLFS